MAATALTFTLLLSLLMQQVCTWNSEKPIYKWSPVWFNYQRYVDKRYNEDKPIYKWSPDFFNKYGSTYGGKRGELSSCGREMTSCVNRHFTSLGILIHAPCCPGLECIPLGNQYFCLETSVSANFEDKQA